MSKKLNEKEFYLPCYDSHKSFYGKAVVKDFGIGDEKLLFSYGTLVAAIVDGKFVRLWDGYSATTMRHVNSFLEHYGFSEGGKAFWDSCEVDYGLRFAWVF